MAGILSLGVHSPFALSYLIAEGLLPRDPAEDLYTCNTYDGTDCANEEVLSTNKCVVWSQDGLICKVYRLDREDETVRTAIITSFAYDDDSGAGDTKDGQRDGRSGSQADGLLRQESTRAHKTTWGSGPQQGSRPASQTETSSSDHGRRTKALVILLESELHVHLLSGPSHVVSLPFDVESIFATPNGLLVKRRPSTATFISLHSVNARVPLKSSFLGQGHALKSPTGRRRVSVLHNVREGTLLHHARDPLMDEEEQDSPALYSLTSPLSGICPVACAELVHQPRANRSDLVGVEYEALDASEEVIYVSSSDELSSELRSGALPLILVVTANHNTSQITVWHGWYLTPPSLASLMRARTALKAAKSRRRSSFFSTSQGTGATTPAVRQREKARESFAAAARLPTELSQPNPHSAAPPSKASQHDEEKMASQMDPEFQPSQKPSKGRRRVSSLLSRADVAADLSRATIGQTAGGSLRRGPSHGAAHDRRSLGHAALRKSRGSTPGSVFSRSLGPEDDLMEVEDQAHARSEQENTTHVKRLIEATHTSAGASALFAGTADGLRQEFVLRKVQSVTLHLPSHKADSSYRKSLKVHTLLSRCSAIPNSHQLRLFVLNIPSRQMAVVNMSVRTHASSKPLDFTPIPKFEHFDSVATCLDIVKTRQADAEAILCLMPEQQIQIIANNTATTWSVPLPKRLRLLDILDNARVRGQQDRDVGRTRTIEFPDGPISLRDGPSGTFDVRASDGRLHRLEVQIRPRSDAIARILAVCQYVLGPGRGDSILRIWCSVHGLLRTEGLGSAREAQREWDSLVVTFFTFAVGSIGRTTFGSPKKHRSQQASRRSTPRHASKQSQPEPSSKPAVAPSSSGAWDWMNASPLASVPSMSPLSLMQRSPRVSGVGRASERSMTNFEAVSRHLLHDLATDGLEWLLSDAEANTRYACCFKILLAVNLFREEQKLNTLASGNHEYDPPVLAAALAQMGHWLELHHWDWLSEHYIELDADAWDFSESVMNSDRPWSDGAIGVPQSILTWLEQSLSRNTEPFPSLDQIAVFRTGMNEPQERSPAAVDLLPRLASLQQFVARLGQVRDRPVSIVEAMSEYGLTKTVLETLPVAVLAPLREALVRCQSSPPSTWPAELLDLTGRDDLTSASSSNKASPKHAPNTSPATITHDIQSIFNTAERAPVMAKTHEADRHAIISLLFAEDRRFVDAARLMNPSAVQQAECIPQPEWSEGEHLEQQRRVMQWVMVRTVSLSAGDAMVHFESQRPLLSEKFHVRGFSTLCQMKPMDNTISADRSAFSEEKLGWAFFHAGVSAGLTISRKASGIDTSWIVFNKPAELSNRHAGFLLALGINGHLRLLAKWLAFKYLTPKHNMTSVGLLLGLSASYLGTMDTLITRMLSVHITRMLPPGAAELNVSPITQTAGLMGIGLLYYNTQHRRMSEIMLSEIEHRELDDTGSTMDILRDESYRLSAGFALGLINLGKGNDLQGLHGMELLERLLSTALGPRQVELVSTVDRATAGAVMALALIYMKTGDRAVARKIDVPDTLAQLDHVRPDVLLLRTLAKNMIMWDEITGDRDWIQRNMPRVCAQRYASLKRKPELKTEDVPFINILAGLAWSLALRFAGSADLTVRDELLRYLDLLITVSKQEAYYYDALLARNTTRRCIDVLALAAATVMAGTGDLETFRFLRRQHGRTDPVTTYGSHLAAHLAIGVLFLGGGTYTFGTSNLAIASLIIAFYPLFPCDVLDNRVHLQALRHLWVFAAEQRCVVVQDVDTQRPISLKLHLALRNGTKKMIQAPCLLPELHTIASIRTDNPAYWQVTLDFVGNSSHLASFQEDKTIHVRKAPAREASSSVFGATLTSLNDSQNTPSARQMWEWVLKLPAFKDFDLADLGLVLPPNAQSAVHLDEKGTVLDDRLTLAKSVSSSSRDELWNLRVLLKWAEEAKTSGDGRLKWLGKDVFDGLRAGIEKRAKTAAETTP